MKRAIVIGASSGIGLELARLLLKRGHAVGMGARRVEILEALLKETHGTGCARKLDVTDFESVPFVMDDMIKELGGMDECYICAGVSFSKPDIRWEDVKGTIDVNVAGFAVVANHAFEYFSGQGGGRIAGVSSFAALRGKAQHPAYCASKAFVSNYMEGLRAKAEKEKLNISVTDIRPGYVDTPMSAGVPGKLWELSAAQAAEKICKAVERRERISYLSKRWTLAARIIRNLPSGVYSKI
jgi:short-subunit dehydrogenase